MKTLLDCLFVALGGAVGSVFERSNHNAFSGIPVLPFITPSRYGKDRKGVCTMV